MAFLMDWMSASDLIKFNTYVFCFLLFLVSAIIGNLSPNDKKFDYLITALVPLALFLTMFLAGFLDTAEFNSGHDFEKGLECAFQSIALIMYLITAASAFAASFKKIRVLRRFFKKISLIK